MQFLSGAARTWSEVSCGWKGHSGGSAEGEHTVIPATAGKSQQDQWVQPEGKVLIIDSTYDL